MTNTYLPSISPHYSSTHYETFWNSFYQGRDGTQHFLPLPVTNPTHVVAMSPTSPPPEAEGHTNSPTPSYQLSQRNYHRCHNIHTGVSRIRITRMSLSLHNSNSTKPTSLPEEPRLSVCGNAFVSAQDICWVDTWGRLGERNL